MPYDQDLVKNAPSIDPDGELSPQEEDHLYAHYGLAGAPATGTGTGVTGGAGLHTSGSEHRQRHDSLGGAPAGRHAAGRGRPRPTAHDVTTENETVQVLVSKEKVTLQSEPITHGNIGQAMDGPAISEEEHEGRAHEERPTVAKEAVPASVAEFRRQLPDTAVPARAGAAVSQSHGYLTHPTTPAGTAPRAASTRRRSQIRTRRPPPGSGRRRSRPTRRAAHPSPSPPEDGCGRQR